jgi:hypothetical protein
MRAFLGHRQMSTMSDQSAVIDRRPQPRRRIITAIANGCASVSASVGADALSDYELMEMVLFRALPRRDVKPLANR